MGIVKGPSNTGERALTLHASPPMTRVRSRVTVAIWAMGLALRVPALVSAQEVQFYHLDTIGNVRVVTNQAGQVVERHDYLPFGEECTTGPCAADTPVDVGQPKHFTGKERDTETGLDYFGARYYGSPIGRFTTIDPLLAARAAMADPQRWNRYAYGRNNPLRYFDPTGAVLELTGGDRDKAFEVIKGVAGSEGGKLLSTRTTEGGRTFVEYSSKDRDSLAATGQIGVYLADIIDSKETTEFAFSTTVRSKHEARTTEYYGGAATVGREESLNGNIQIFLDPNAAGIMWGIANSPLGWSKSSSGQPLFFSDAIIAAHEFGHAWANLRGDPLYLSHASDPTALRVENLMRAKLGLTDTRVRH